MTVADDRLIDMFVQANPSRPGAEEARIIRYGVPVWALIAHAQATGGDPDQVARDYGLPRQAVDAAFAYYQRHKAALDARIAANAA
jgi:uncharacterized protein (DUF433 family)